MSIASLAALYSSIAGVHRTGSAWMAGNQARMGLADQFPRFAGSTFYQDKALELSTVQAAVNLKVYQQLQADRFERRHV